MIFSTGPKKPSCIEVLESRIAPALLVQGANLLGGVGHDSKGETSIGENAVTLVEVLSGQALVWYDGNAITGISVGPNVRLDLTGDVNDIVANLTASGHLTDSDNDPANGEDGNLLLPNKILGITTHPLSNEKGSVHSIITGGSISGLSISGEIEGVYAGDGVFRVESRELEANGSVVSSLGAVVDINPVVPGMQSAFSFHANDATHTQFLPGASIKDADFSNGRQLQVIAGSGNPNGRTFNGTAPAGGSISGIQIDSAFVPSTAPEGTPSYGFYAGAGGSGGHGGVGGSISNVLEKTSFGPVVMKAGQGGDGASGAGGAGGSVLNVDVQSDSSRYTVLAGNGGSGAPGGAGGKLQSLNFSNRTPVAGILLSADFNGDGFDDVLVADAGTGQMVLSLKNPNSAGFTQAVQYFDDNDEPVNLIGSAGSTPVDAVVVDFNRDGKLDVLVAYQNSSSLAIYLNEGNGSFYRPGDDGQELQAIKVSLGYAPAKIAVSGINADQVAIAENTDGKGFLHLAEAQSSAGANLGYTLVAAAGSNDFKQPIADLAFSNATTFGEVLFVGFQSGAISGFAPGSSTSKTPFDLLTPDLPSIAGGITDFDIGNDGSQLAVLSRAGKSLTVFEVENGGLTTISTLDLSSFGGKPTVAHFVQQIDNDDIASNDRPDQVAVLTSLASGSRIDLFGPAPDDGNPETVEGFSAITTLNSSEAFKNFVPAYSGPGAKNIAALAGSLSEFYYSPELRDVDSYGLPFATKKIVAEAGDGGRGRDASGPNAKGGAGGNVLGINADAHEIVLAAGNGGASDTKAGGRGGSITNPEDFVTASGSTVAPVLLADVGIQITAGAGGTPALSGLSAAGGAGGSVSGLSIILAEGDFFLEAGRGGDGRGADAGAGGNINKITTMARDGSLFVVGGKGGNALGAAGLGGAGGNITKLTHTLTLEEEVESLEKPYRVELTAGQGGTSANATGGAGGLVSGVALQLDGSDLTYDLESVTPPLVDSHRDNTVKIIVAGGSGGVGVRGGAGGSIADFVTTSIFDQTKKVNDGVAILTNFVALKMSAGDGGTGTAGRGGAGGSIHLKDALSGITSFDNDAVAADNLDFANLTPLIVHSGRGGDGTKGGAGGDLSGLIVQNAPFTDGAAITGTQVFGAEVFAGLGGNGSTGNGGTGGSLMKTRLAVQGAALFAGAGNGGSGAGKGGAGGAVSDSYFGLVSGAAMLVSGGNGGTGVAAGGAGGVLRNLALSSPGSTQNAVVKFFGGRGGDATGSGALGGAGGSVSQLNQNKDVNSSISAIIAGSGGDALQGTGGRGGSVSAIKTVGFLGKPSTNSAALGLFDEFGDAQGVFAGVGGSGATSAASAGSVIKLEARQIAAIAAINEAGEISLAKKVANVTADYVGYDPGYAASGVHTYQSGDGLILAGKINVSDDIAPFQFTA